MSGQISSTICNAHSIFRAIVACLILLFPIKGKTALPCRLVVAQKGRESFVVMAGKQFSIKDGIQAFRVSLSDASTCEVMLMPDVPVITLVNVASTLSDLSISNVAWSVFDESETNVENLGEASIIRCEVKVMGRDADQVRVFHPDYVNSLPDLDEASSDVLTKTNKAVLESCRNIAAGVKKVLPEDFIISGPVYIAKGESSMFRTEENGYYILAVAWRDPNMLFPGRSTKLILTFLHPSYVFTSQEMEKTPGKTIVTNKHVVIHAMGDYAKTWPSIGADLSRSFSMSMGLEFGTGKSLDTNESGIGDEIDATHRD